MDIVYSTKDRALNGNEPETRQCRWCSKEYEIKSNDESNGFCSDLCETKNEISIKSI